MTLEVANDNPHKAANKIPLITLQNLIPQQPRERFNRHVHVPHPAHAFFPFFLFRQQFFFPRNVPPVTLRQDVFRIAETVSLATIWPFTLACTATSKSCRGRVFFNFATMAFPFFVEPLRCVIKDRASTGVPLTNTSKRTTSAARYPASS